MLMEREFQALVDGFEVDYGALRALDHELGYRVFCREGDL